MTVTGVNDDVDDGDVAYTIVTAAAASTDADYTGSTAADVSVTNTDDDAAGITVDPDRRADDDRGAAAPPPSPSSSPRSRRPM